MAQPAATTWHRLLTDPVGGFVELSTKSDAPTAPLWREAVAKFNSCFRSTCTRPASECEMDHREAWPEGATASGNLWPACKLDHKARDGFSVGDAANALDQALGELTRLAAGEAAALAVTVQGVLNELPTPRE